MKTLGILPARYGSSRWPGKVLQDIGGKSMLQRTFEQARKAELLDDLLVATDDERVQEHVHRFGGRAVLTGTVHRSGTDRCAEAVEQLASDVDIVLNIQADEPFLPPGHLDRVVRMLQAGVPIATVAHPITSSEELWSPAAVKIVLDRAGRALYFSRSPVPYLRDVPREEWLQHHTFYRHIGLYGFQAPVLQRIARFQPGELEEAEKLEQLRWMEGGLPIQVGLVHTPSMGMDQPDDAARAEQWLASRSS